MRRLLSEGSIVSTESSAASCVVGPLLGHGAQGEVYRANVEGRGMALKWYFPETIERDPALAGRLRTAIRSGSPSSRFIWPLELAVDPASGEFGYIMRERESRFVEFARYWSGSDVLSFRHAATTGFELAHAFLALHGLGLCYADINDRNVFVDPDLGDIAICDNDNVTSEGKRTAIRGTIGFRALEIADGSAEPSDTTDLHSLAVLLFLSFVKRHPYEGALADRSVFDAAAQRAVYEGRSAFIFDPGDPTNELPATHATVHRCWTRLPTQLRSLFIRAFTEGFRDRRARIAAGEWRRVLIEARDAVYYCPRCGAENVFDSDRPDLSACGTCATQTRSLLLLKLERQTIVLNSDTTLTAHHLAGPRARFDFETIVARVESHPERGGAFALKNLTESPWRMRNRTGDWLEVPSRRSVPLAPGNVIDFGHTTGVVATAGVER